MLTDAEQEDWLAAIERNNADDETEEAAQQEDMRLDALARKARAAQIEIKAEESDDQESNDPSTSRVKGMLKESGINNPPAWYAKFDLFDDAGGSTRDTITDIPDLIADHLKDAQPNAERRATNEVLSRQKWLRNLGGVALVADPEIEWGAATPFEYVSGSANASLSWHREDTLEGLCLSQPRRCILYAIFR